MLIEIVKKSSYSGYSIIAKVSQEVESKDSPEIHKMREAVDSIIPNTPQQHTQCYAQTKGANGQMVKMASEQQLSYLNRILEQKDIDVKAFCKEHSVKKLADLTMKDCRQIIGDLKDDKFSPENYF